VNEDDKPNPDELLEALHQEETLLHAGKLKIFFGMSAGVGKTYSMLEEAHQRLKEGVNVVVGTINTHGRKETEELLKGLTLIPEKWVTYKDTVFEEFDLETILKLKPALVLIDEFAHTNVPGSKHSKRWQDVIEILDAGIDVYTTLNVQHIESRKDLVESITKIQIRETIPDIIFERAVTIELIDLPPSELLQRLKEGKVCVQDQSHIAAQNFFIVDKLTALREITLRFAAEKVEYDLHRILSKTGEWKTRDRLMVAISADPSSQALIRAARKLAFELDTPWVVVYVDNESSHRIGEQAQLTKYLTLARHLGAEVIVTKDDDESAAILRIIKQKNITSMLISRSQNRKNRFSLFQTSLAEKLAHENKQIDIIILKQDALTSIYQKIMPAIKITTSRYPSYLLATLGVVLATLFCYVLYPLAGPLSLGYIYLFNITILSYFLEMSPIFFAATLSAIAWNALFFPPYFHLRVKNSQEFAVFILFFLTVITMGYLNNRLRRKAEFLRKREQKIERLYQIEKEITNAKDLPSLRFGLDAYLKNIFAGEYDILVHNEENRLVVESRLEFLNQEKEKSAAIWTFQNGQLSGLFTDTLPSAEALYFPIRTAKAALGVFVYHPKQAKQLPLDDINFLQTVAQQLSGFLERFIFEEKVQKQEYKKQTEKIHKAIFHSFKRSFFTPLEEILQLAHQIQKTNEDASLKLQLKKIEGFHLHLELVVSNIIAISEIDSGFLHFEKKSNNLLKLIDSAVSETHPFMNGHPITINVPSVFLPFDFNLLQLAMINLLVNACEYSEQGKPITISAEVLKGECRICIVDQGSGIPEEILPFIFEKFYRRPSEVESPKEMGLGLAIVKAVVEIHQGKIEVQNQEGGGTAFSLILPLS